MSKVENLQYETDSNDHFTFEIIKNKKFDQFEQFADLTMKFAIEALEFMGYDLAKTKIKECK